MTFAVNLGPAQTGSIVSAGEYNWGGAAGTYYWADPKEEMFVLFMMQSPKQRVPYRALLKNMIYGAIVR